jgi:serine/threonine-protein phosphatase 2A regulatory subunit A
VAAANKVSALASCLTQQQIVQHIVPCVRDLSVDNSQYVRAALASVVMELAPMLGRSGTIDHLVPVFLTLLKDMYPDVRLNVISKLSQVNEVSTWVKKQGFLQECPVFPPDSCRRRP